MDAYPADFVQHNLPFIVLSGLATSKELEPVQPIQQVLPGRAVTSIHSEIPPVTGERAEQLLQAFQGADGSAAPWNGRAANRRDNLVGFRIRSVGREFQLPPKKADAPTTSDTTPPGSPTIAAATSWVLHSPISPLSPYASVYPDGVIAPAWVAKYQHYVPSVFASFFHFTTDPTTTSLHDNQLKTEINKIRGQIQKSDYRTRFVVVLLSDKTILEAPDIEDRLTTIRRATGLDPKNSLFFLPPNTSQVELHSFVISILSTLQPICVEYYRDLTKHARRKKGRGTIPPPTAPPTRGTSQTLSQPGWAVRYDFKLGVLAEFRQEMDAAQRHYGIALEGLFGPEGLFETTASWSPRWDEIRLLADSVALRHLRCQLWNNHPTSAVQTWFRYKTRLKDLLDRRGKGSSNYGWEAWESRWAQAMAQVIQRTDLPVFKITQPLSEMDPLVDGMIATYAPPERQIPIGEKLPPWEQLHHAGYWYKVAADHAKRRYLIAREMPEEDRTPPGMSPATRVSNRNQIYDTFMVPEPHLEYPLPGTTGGFEHWKDIVAKLNASIGEFKARDQQRKVEQLQLEVARTLLHMKQFDDAFSVLRPLWAVMAWRREGWWSLASEVLWGLHECALRVQNAETYVATEWELHSQVISGKSRYKYDLMSCLDSFTQDDPTEKISVSLDTKDYISCLSSSFAFAEGEGNVGEHLRSQIVATSSARPGSAPITLSALAFQFKGCLSEVRLSHEAEESPSDNVSRLYECSLEEMIPPAQKPRWIGTADLTLRPGQTKVYEFSLTFREAGEVEGATSLLEILTDRFDLVCSSEMNVGAIMQPLWWLKSGPKIKSRKLHQESGSVIKVLPKPPKMEIYLPDLRNQYYTDEPVELMIELQNKEEEETEVVLEVRLLGRSKDTLGFSWVERAASSPMKEVPPPLSDSTDMDLPGHVVGRLVQGAHTVEKIRFDAPSEPSDYALEVKALYHILSDRDTPISKTMIADLIFNAPFEASFDLTPRGHLDPWPSYYEFQEAESNDHDSAEAFGIAQKWGLKTKIASFADEPLVVKNFAIEVHNIHGGATCAITNEFPIESTTMNPQALTTRSFCIDSRKLSLEERRTTSLDTTLNISWQRSSSSQPTTSPSISLPTTITTRIPIPRIQLPSSEPRVLARSTPSSTIPSLFHLDYSLENPTMHFLTFELNMEASEDFGFSGPKSKTLHLLPMSRQGLRFNLFPRGGERNKGMGEEGAGGGGGDWIRPTLRVVDRYFNKELKVLGSEGLVVDREGVRVWVGGSGGGDGGDSGGGEVGEGG